MPDAYRSPAAPDSALLHEAARPTSRVVLIALGAGGLLLGSFSVFLGTAALAVPAAGFVAAAWLMFVLRIKTAIHADRVVQGRLASRTLRLGDVTHVIHRDAAIDPLVASTALSAAQTDEVLLYDASGARVSLTRLDLPDELRASITEAALATAVETAEREIARGGRYADPDRIHGLDAERLHGFTIGLTRREVSATLAEVASLEPSGVVRRTNGESFHVGAFDRVLRELLARRGIG